MTDADVAAVDDDIAELRFFLSCCSPNHTRDDASAALDRLAARLQEAERERDDLTGNFRRWDSLSESDDELVERLGEDLLRVANRTLGFNHEVLYETILSRVSYWLRDRAAAELRVAALEQDLDIERESNPNRVVCPKCQANLPCESCKRYSVLRDELESRVAALQDGLREYVSDHSRTWLTGTCICSLCRRTRSLLAGDGAE